MRLAAGLPQAPSRNVGPTSKRKFCTKFGCLIIRKIIKFVATRRQIIGLKCTKLNFGWGSAPDPSGELTALPWTP